MPGVIRSVTIGTLAVVTAIVVGLVTTWTSVALAATALIMGGTGHPLSIPQDTPSVINGFVNGASSNYITPSGLCVGGSPGCTPLTVYTPEQFRFDTGLTDLPYDQSQAIGRANLDDCLRGNSCTVTPSPYVLTSNQTLADTSYTVYGYSSSAGIATLEKQDLANNPVPNTSVSFVLAGNPNRPNGGILERFHGLYIPLVGVSFDGATITDTTMTTVDVARQYDAISDFPTNPLNLLADLNAGFGFIYLHPNYFDVGTPQLQGQFGDTTYYLIPTQTLPLLIPLQALPVIGPALAAALDPVVRVLVETAYDRTVNPGAPTTAQFSYFPNPIATAVNLLQSLPIGLDNGIAELTGNAALRPFGTSAPASPYGVNGPPVNTGCGTPPCGTPTPVEGAAATASTATTATTAKLAEQSSPVAPTATPTPSTEKQIAAEVIGDTGTGATASARTGGMSASRPDDGPSAAAAPAELTATATGPTPPSIGKSPGLLSSILHNGHPSGRNALTRSPMDTRTPGDPKTYATAPRVNDTHHTGLPHRPGALPVGHSTAAYDSPN